MIILFPSQNDTYCPVLPLHVAFAGGNLVYYTGLRYSENVIEINQWRRVYWAGHFIPVVKGTAREDSGNKYEVNSSFVRQFRERRADESFPW